MKTITVDVDSFRIAGEYANCGSHMIRIELDVDDRALAGALGNEVIDQLTSEKNGLSTQLWDEKMKVTRLKADLELLGELHAYAKLGYEGAAGQLAEILDTHIPADPMASKFP